jgi:hypothetical protein
VAPAGLRFNYPIAGGVIRRNALQGWFAAEACRPGSTDAYEQTNAVTT